MKSLKYILLLVVVAALVGLSWYAGYKFTHGQIVEKTDVTVVLEKVKKVFKLVTVEGQISEIYTHQDYYTWDIQPFRKKALVRVNAKVLVGYDFEKVVFTVDEESQTISISSFPEAEILSFEHDLDYYDITQGAFNQFTTDDYNLINQKVKEYARTKALESDLLLTAEEQKDEILDMFDIIVGATGWKLLVGEREVIRID